MSAIMYRNIMTGKSQAGTTDVVKKKLSSFLSSCLSSFLLSVLVVKRQVNYSQVNVGLLFQRKHTQDKPVVYTGVQNKIMSVHVSVRACFCVWWNA